MQEVCQVIANSPADTTVVVDQENAWRLFTKGMSKDEAFQRASFKEDEMLARKVFETISIIGLIDSIL